MKRSPELTPLSRDHHKALEVALRLRRATAGNVDEAIEHFLAFWSHQGERHFAPRACLLGHHPCDGGGS